MGGHCVEKKQGLSVELSSQYSKGRETISRVPLIHIFFEGPGQQEHVP
jgi:hypothetical protein